MANVIDGSMPIKEIKDIPVVREFSDVFQRNYGGCHPTRKLSLP